MIDLIKQSAVPANVMRSAARGALSLPPNEIVEILVYLSTHHLFGEQARLSLAGFDSAQMKAIAVDPQTPPEVLQYMASPENIRPALTPMLLENSSVPQASLLQLALSHSKEVLAAMTASARVRGDQTVLQTLLSNGALPPNNAAELQQLVGSADSEPSEHSPEDLLEINGEIERYVKEHAEEIAAEEAKGFELTDLTEDEKAELQAKVPADPSEQKRMSPLQKISKMGVMERVQLAMRGNREERFILIRDGCKTVSAAVLDCPKLTDSEIENFAGLKNVQEGVLRKISMKRKFMKLYPVVRSLASNPRCPLDVALPLLKSLLVQDLKALSTNKNVADTLRKLAFKMFKEKSSSSAKKGE